MPPRDLDDQVVVRRLTAIRELVGLLARQGEVSGPSRGSPSPRTTVRRSTRLREPD